MCSENSSLARSEKGCEKVKKPQWRIKTEPDGVEMHEGNLWKKEQQCYLSAERRKRTKNIYLEAAFLLPEYINEKPGELSTHLKQRVCVLKSLTYRQSFVQLSIFGLIIEPVSGKYTHPCTQANSVHCQGFSERYVESQSELAYWSYFLCIIKAEEQKKTA